MSNIINYERFFAYSSPRNRYFFTEFSPGLNIIHGKNTSGKSTLIQAILYTFGINDGKDKLKEILDENVIFRLDLTLTNHCTEKISIIRDNDFLIVNRENHPQKRFSGVSTNNSNEHKSLKCYLAKLLGSNLHLQAQDGYTPAAIEAMFLPYYVAQDVGWTAQHNSFCSLDFIKNFRNDFFDYYLGIINDYDRERKEELDKRKKSLNTEISFLERFETENEQIQLAKLQDEQYVNESNNYLEQFRENKKLLIELENQYLELCNKFSFQEKQKSLLLKVKRSLDKQQPIINKCPTCNQDFSGKLIDLYEYHQNKNDTTKQIEKIKVDLKSFQSKIYSVKNKIDKLKNSISRGYSIISLYKINNLTFNTWITGKVNIRFSKELLKNIEEKNIELRKVLNDLNELKTDEQINTERSTFNEKFKTTFIKYLKELNVKLFKDKRYYLLYAMPKHPRYQGVELLKAMLAYNFAFVLLISETEYVHKLPLLLDAIFKEDIDEENKSKILKFIYKYKSINHQIIITVASSEEDKIKTEDYNRNYFNNEANLICINIKTERAFLTEYSNQHDKYLEETLSFIE